MTAKKELTWEVDEATGCWNVISHRPNTQGYSQLKIQKRHVLAHRLMWEQTYGQIPSGLCVCHTCDNPRCINPAHLWLGTMKDNADDRDRKGRCPYPKGQEHGNAKLTNIQVMYIREHLEINNLEMGRQMGVSSVLISQIRLRKVWKHLP